MKFRTDFVTNSSDTSYMAFNIKNRQLYDCLTRLGIKFENTKDGEFRHYMKVILPSGKSEEIDGFDNWALPYFDNFASISAWLVATMLWEVGFGCPEEYYSDFSKELIQILNNADITHLDWDVVDTWSRDELNKDLEKEFGKMDESIEDARIEHTYGMEGEVGPALYTEIHNGERMTASYSNFSWGDVETENASGLCFAITGELSIFKTRTEMVKRIEEMGGSVTDDVTNNTDYVICNYIYSTSVKMKKAKEYGVSVLSEMAFIRRFCDIEEFDEIDEDQLEANEWNLAHDGGVLSFVMRNGTQPITMEIWDGEKWIKAISEKKVAEEKAKKLKAENEARALMSFLYDKDDGTLTKLLTVTSRDCLESEEEKQSSDISKLDFEDLCKMGYFVFESGKIDPETLKQDCVIAVSKNESKGFIFGDTILDYLFIVICKSEISDMSDCKSRPMEICVVLNDLANGRNVPGIGKIYFDSASTGLISEKYSSCFLWVGPDARRKRKRKNIITGYNRDNKAILYELFSDNDLRAIMDIDDMPVTEIYEKGYFGVANNLEHDYESWIVAEWNFETPCGLVIAAVNKDRDKLKKMIPIITEHLSGFELPVRGKLKYKDDYSRLKIKLSEGIFAAILHFKK